MSRMSNHNLSMHLGVRFALVVMLLGVLMWSLWSKPAKLANFDLDEVLLSPESAPEKTNSQFTRQRIDATVFDVELWHVPQVVEPVAERVVQQPTQLNLQLMAITEESGMDQGAGRTAVIYDPDYDRIHRVRVGTQIGSYRVREITASSVEIGAGRRIAVLELELLEPNP